jgi:hypothetical protein
MLFNRTTLDRVVFFRDKYMAGRENRKQKQQKGE